MTRVYKGFGTTLPMNHVDRQVELKRLMERRDQKAKELNEKIINTLYVERKEGTPEPQ